MFNTNLTVRQQALAELQWHEHVADAQWSACKQFGASRMRSGANGSGRSAHSLTQSRLVAQGSCKDKSQSWMYGWPDSHPMGHRGRMGNGTDGETAIRWPQEQENARKAAD